MQTWGAKALLAGGMLVAVAGLASAQSMGGAAGSGGFSGGGSSSSSGGFTGTSGGFTGSSGSATGGFTGTSGGFTGAGGNQGGVRRGAGVGAGRTGTATGGTLTPGSTTPFGRYYDNPLYNGLTSGQSASSSTNGSKYLRQPPVAVSFGTPLYTASNTATTTRTATQQSGTTAFNGANSLGFRRAPGYTTAPVFDMPARPSLASMQPQLQDIVARATRLPSRNNIRVITQGDAIVLRGRVRDERERRLAEALIRLTPGVGLVKNELQPPER